MNIDIDINGNSRSIDIDPDTPLLYAIRNQLNLKGTRFGCGQGSCGACMVLIDGEPVQSCDLPVSEVGDRSVRTIEALADGSHLHRLQEAFIAEQAAQCGYCTSGVLMAACALLERNESPSSDEIREALDGNLCRCGTHWRMVRAVERAAGDEEIPTGQPVSIMLPPGTDPGHGIGNEYLTVNGDGTVMMHSGKVDIGQGVTTALAQIAADALGVAVGRIRVLHTDTGYSPNEGMTAGSFSIQNGGTAMREAGEALRDQLIGMATEEIGSVADELSIDDGTVTAPSGEAITYWEIAHGSDSLPGGSAEAVVGSSLGRWDIPAKVVGEPSFIQDLELPGILHGRIVNPPTQTARLEAVDPESTQGMPGVIEVVRSGSFLGVIAEREEQAINAARRLANAATWTDGDGPDFDPADPTYLYDCADVESVVAPTAPGAPGTGSVKKTYSATYTRGYLVHGSIGPSCALALDRAEELSVWTHSQGVYPLRTSLARALNRPEDSIRVIHSEGAGCYGHNGADDVALDAALLARAVPGRPVRLQWSREDEFRREPYGSPMIVQLEAGLDEDGTIVEWSHRGWSHPHTSRPGAAGGINLLSASLLDAPDPEPRLQPIPFPGACMLRNAVPLYDFESADVVGNFIPKGPVRTSALRGLGSQPNIFAMESFMDELADAAGADPVEFRLRHLSDPRARHVIEKVVERAGVPVGGRNDEGHGFGLGFGRYKNVASYVAVIAQVEAERQVRVVKAWAVVDAGKAINPDGIANQIEGGMIQSASWALKEQVTFENGQPNVTNWVEYPIMTFSETPDLDVYVVDRPDEPSVGVGEGSQGPMSAAIGNAVRAALGVPIRDMPITPDRIMKAILA